MDTDHAVGTLWGLACGDALGRPVEFQSAASIEREHGRVTEMLADGTWSKPAGTVTDDTDLALCLARSLVERGRFDGADVARRFGAWLDSGPFDVGGMTRESIREVQSGTAWAEAGRRVWERKPEGSNAGNGSAMRCAPNGLAFADDPDALIRVSRESSAITHADPRCTWGCAVLNLTIAALPDADEPASALESALDRCDDAPAELRDALAAVPGGVDPTELRSTGYVVHTLQTALSEGLTAPSAEEAIVRAVNRGGDADTVGAVTGAIAGARFGRDAIPERWLDVVEYREELAELGTALATTDIEPA